MALARTHAMALVGVRAHLVEIEADIENGLVALLLVGLPDTALREARDRIRSAIVNSGEAWPQRRITVGLSPASLPKRGSGFDLGLAAAIMAAAGAVPADRLSGMVFLGELGLDGRVRAVPGVLPAAAAAAEAGFQAIAVPPENVGEATLVPGLRVLSTPTLGALLAWLRGKQPSAASVGGVAGTAASSAPGAGAGRVAVAEMVEPGAVPAALRAASPAASAASTAAESAAGHGRDLADVIGQPMARRAVEICAAGGHHLLLLGPPGVGKTMLAERLPTILPPLELAAALEVSSIHSVAGTLPPGRPLMTEPPFCAPHHTATKAAIVGGGSGVIRPGAASLAHHGCLFLDEAPEFGRDVLDALRQPLESGEVIIARSGLTAVFPARFTLVLAANPCPCARASTVGSTCTCTPMVRRRYLARLSGPLLDRVDVKVELLPVGRTELLSDRQFAEPSAVVAARVGEARLRAARRLRGTRWRLNAEIPGAELRRTFRPAPGALAPLERALDLGEISARGVDRIVRLSWTLADLAGVHQPGTPEIGYALGLWLGVGQ
ncbi:MAG TPA: YifB family Mg chelatase-like AAA ATPase [Streptosporangiaceae bacterium]|nr:YifB family Mg chelatase-like AAA ATPase [Streptosporangiaceae bacterium]